jgi:hypothetical protein
MYGRVRWDWNCRHPAGRSPPATPSSALQAGLRARERGRFPGILRLPVRQAHSGIVQVRDSLTVAGAASALLRNNTRERTDFPFHPNR